MRSCWFGSRSRSDEGSVPLNLQFVCREGLCRCLIRPGPTAIFLFLCRSHTQRTTPVRNSGWRSDSLHSSETGFTVLDFLPVTEKVSPHEHADCWWWDGLNWCNVLLSHSFFLSFVFSFKLFKFSLVSSKTNLSKAQIKDVKALKCLYYYPTNNIQFLTQVLMFYSFLSFKRKKIICVSIGKWRHYCI